MAPKPTDDDRIPCTSPDQLQQEIDGLIEALAPVETEHTWEKLERAIIRFAAVTRGGGYKFPAVYVEGVGRKGAGPRLVDCMLSDRGRLSGVATDLLTTMAPRLSIHFSPLVSIYLPIIIKLLGRPNKVYFKRADRCLTIMVMHCPVVNMLGMLRLGIDDKAEPCRRACGGAFERATEDWSRDVVGSKGITEIEGALRKMATDRDAEVRKIGKRMWEIYSAKWPERVDDFTAPLTPTIRRYLDITQTKAKPRPATVRVAPPPTAAPRSLGLSKAPSTANLHALVTRTVPPIDRDSLDHAFTRPVLSTSMSASTSRMPSSMTISSFPVAGHSRAASSSSIPQVEQPRVVSGPIRPMLTHSAASSGTTASSSTSAPPVRRIVSGGGPIRPVKLGASTLGRGPADGKTGASPAVSSLGKAVRPGRILTLSALGQSQTPWLDDLDEDTETTKKAEVIRRRVVSGGSGLEKPKLEVVERSQTLKMEDVEEQADAVVGASTDTTAPSANEVETSEAIAPTKAPEVIPEVIVPEALPARATIPVEPATIAPPRANIGRGREAFKPSSSSAGSKAKIVMAQVKKPMQMSTSTTRTAVHSQGPTIIRKGPTLVASSAGLHPRSKPTTSQAPTPTPATARVPRVLTKPPVPQLSGVKRKPLDRSQSRSGSSSPTKSSITQGISEEDTISGVASEDTITLPVDPAPSTVSGSAPEHNQATPADPFSELVQLQGKLLESEGVKANIFSMNIVSASNTVTGPLLDPSEVPLPLSPTSDTSGTDEPVLARKPSTAFSVSASTVSGDSDVGGDGEEAQSSAESEDPMAGMSFKSPSKRGQPVRSELLQRNLARSQFKMALARAGQEDAGRMSSRKEHTDLMEFSDGSQAGSSIRTAPLIDLNSTRTEPVPTVNLPNSQSEISATMALLAKSINNSSTPMKSKAGLSKSERVENLRKERGFTPSSKSKSEGGGNMSGSTTPMSTPPRSKPAGVKRAFVGTPLRGL